MPSSDGYRIICQYRQEETSWGPFKTVPEVSSRLTMALENLEKENDQLPAGEQENRKHHRP